MIKMKSISIIVVLCAFPLSMLLSQGVYEGAEFSIYDSTEVYESKCAWAIDKRHEYPDDSYAILQEGYKYFLAQKDTNNIITCLMAMSDYTTLCREYALSFQYLWQSLILAETINDYTSIAVSNRRLARLYNIYEMTSQSMLHLQAALQASKQGDMGEGSSVQLNVTYRNLASKERSLGHYDKAFDYLDSCLLDDKALDTTPWYVVGYYIERARLFMELKDYVKAEQAVVFAEGAYATHSDEDMMNIYRAKGDLYAQQGATDRAIYAYEKAIGLSEKLPYTNINNAYLYRKLSRLYGKKKRYDLAYTCLDNSQLFADSLKTSQIQNISEIFKINNTFQEALLDKEATIERQVEIIEDKDDVQNRLRIIIGLLLLLIVTLGFVIQMRFRLKKSLKYQEETELRAKLDEEQREKQMNLKNQELTSFALQLVDKETSVKELLEKIKQIDPKEYKQLRIKYQVSEQGLWEEFNLRFTDVNKGFYERLIAQFPTLSRTEQKHCALIKLNFSTKEMAQILNVEGHTINMSRSRIRKKMGLDRSENLSNFISAV